MSELMEKDTKQDLLEAFVKVAPFLNQLVQDDITVGVYDTEKLIINIPAKTFSLNVKPGDPLAEGDIITEAIRHNAERAAIVPKELFGFPLIAKAIPLHDSKGKVIGGVGMGTSLEKANKLFEMAESFSAIVEETAASIEEISDSVTKLTEQVTDVSSHMKNVSVSAEQIGEISSVVRGISDQSNLLGLNAAIEAARAGESGKGFSVVANEIRKLATNSKENVSQINDITNTIQDLLKKLNEAFSEIHQLTDTQAGSIEEFAATMQEISRNAQDLAKVAEISLPKE
ncbi:methyl-accepting chemotaxis protein [Halalkalibacterium halodurans]|nr:methyl-accepting chemotaxis protein [Halalkalibacterium halodurans]MDY7221543.1 methyl-accepting chemotaxis protein [Halalkalibacterium halodurans]MDY7240819.1 methyl-accepting chemotaxis protein [Halalkalibacterium halodurans]MED3647173.1 methyl-accepting chemotaxis protein [Halalkalibacterium halodurans]MED4080474.1 methyl-accepting chemotaxis protein [Halalkalibacterium halodurans]MED4086513.1 methyl-accepting chemotaxis protein [Halalkalibacterium halodurans]